MIKSILIPIDDSPAAKSALSIASSIAGLIEANLIGLFVRNEQRLMHVSFPQALAGSLGLEPITQSPLPPEQLLNADEELENTARLVKEQFSSHCTTAHISGTFIIRTGTPRSVIIELARCVDFIVIGNTGKHTGLSNEEPGLTTNALLHATTRPVLVVPPEPAGESCMVIAYDGSPASERALRVAAELSTVADLDEVHLLTVTGNKDQAHELQQPALEYLAHYSLDIRHASLDGNPVDVIPEYVDQVDASILACGAFGSNRIKERIFGSTTEAVLRKANAAVLLTS